MAQASATQAQPSPTGALPQMVATAHPLATEAGLKMLAQGGTAVDAVIAAQLVLGLVEPQSSGLGGGLLMLHWDAAARRLTAIDGLAAAPGRTTASLRTDVDGRLLPSEPSQRGGRSIGVPGALPALVLAHERHGRLPWRQLVEPARQAAQEGFAMPPYLHAVLAPTTGAAELRAAFGLYFDAEGRPMPVGTLIRHPAYANTMRDIGDKGPGAWLAQRGTSGLLEAAQQGFRPSLMTAEDIQAYRAVVREPLCAPFRAYRVCTTPPPSFGGIAVLQILQTVQAVKSIGPLDFNDPGFLHLFAEAGKLAQADRRLHVGDPDHVRVPAQDLVAEPYVRERAQQIDPARAMPEPAAGRPTGLASTTAPGPSPLDARALMAGAGRCPDGGCTSGPVFVPAQVVPDDGPTFGQTSQIAVADRHGNVVSVTTTNNLNFGARLAFDGVVLNNAMTNFSAAPKPGQVLANQMAPAKRPVTSMAPTIAFDAHGRPVLAGGSAGGGPIVDYVAASLMDMLANGRTPDQAVARAHITTATPSVLQLERGRGMEALAAQLQAQGHAVEMVSLPSGQVYIRRVDNGWVGAVDPRRDGVASSR